MIALVLATSLTLAPLKTIVNERTGPVCTVLREVVARLDSVDDSNRDAIARETRAADLYDRFDFQLFPNDHPVMFAFEAESNAVTVLQHLHEMDAAIEASYRRAPARANAQADALRASAQRIVDLQRALANAVIVSAGLIEDGDANARVNRNIIGTMPVDEPPASPSPPPGAQTAQAVRRDDDPVAATPPPGLPARMLDAYAPDALSDALGSERQRLSELRQAAAKQCSPR